MSGMRERLRDLWNWYSFGVRDNGLLGYLRHARAYERARRSLMPEMRRNAPPRVAA